MAFNVEKRKNYFVTMNEEERKAIIQDLNLKIGSDINNLGNAYNVENELVSRRDRLMSCLHVVNDAVPIKITSAIEKAEKNIEQIHVLKEKSLKFKNKVEDFLLRTQPLRLELNRRFTAINELEAVLAYVKSYEKIEELSQQMKQSNDDEFIVGLYEELKNLRVEYQNGHRAKYLKEYTHYWHNILKDKFTGQYEDVLKLLKWPITTGVENSPPPKDVLVKFTNLTRFLFLIEEPQDETVPTETEIIDYIKDADPCLPVRILLRPLKKRFMFHFTGQRQTARYDRPEWFLTQTLTWIKDHQTFVSKNVQPVADKLQLKNVNAVDEFNSGLIALAAERLHTVLGFYHTQGVKGTFVDVDSAFAHAVDETLGFHKELVTLTGKDMNSVLSVLTKAETFVRWLAVEKKYALAKMDETLGNENWSEAVAEGVGAAVGSVVWVPRGADWFVALLKTIEDRYAMLPQPGHRLQFLELQLELIEEWRVRLTQLMNAAIGSLNAEALLAPGPVSRQLTAAINAAYHTRAVLLQWAHSLHYLQLHYYRRQFQQFTQQQHREDSENNVDGDEENPDNEHAKKSENKNGDTMSLEEVELRAKKLAFSNMSRLNSIVNDDYDPPPSPVKSPSVFPDVRGADEAGVFDEAGALFDHLKDAGLAFLVRHVFVEFKAAMRDYKRQKWHAMMTVEQQALCVSAPLCRPLGELCARVAVVAARLAPPMAARVRAHLASAVDKHVFEEVALECWFNTGGSLQFTHDVQRNLVPALAPPCSPGASQINPLFKLMETCKLLNMDYDDARQLRTLLAKQPSVGSEHLAKLGIRQVHPNEALLVLNQRTDLIDPSSPSSVMELF